jgi:hypothetical protein
MGTPISSYSERKRSLERRKARIKEEVFMREESCESEEMGSGQGESEEWFVKE